ncbi:GDP-mannose 4,6-dehydratase [Candidatus Viridilinea mediisalina]|uniref:GDP-mannose 4,6-dehydratase n=1 Tax=Candidatus Viridilinea mediisalina TaxID=2024553 RepID=A0A2A6RQ20_9CHLR|nr:GDP-mannose 4,6-dehydratase [Candidatus Viridilinea mediisalina]PDW04978.1 GDP-mannose 4,6-dehydratase [Candidatus Viridilinea mediisalina]
MRILITGLTGPVGSFLADYLLTLPGLELHALKRWRSDPRPIAHLRGRVTLHEGDIEDPFAVDRTLAAVRPDRVFHLAAQSYPSASWEAPIHTMRINVEGTLNLLEAVRRHAPQARVHIAGTSAQYGTVRPDQVPISETHPMRPASPYGVSKVAAELSGLQYHDNFGLHVFVTRSFNHVGPRQGDRCSIQTFCQQMAAIELGQQEPILYVGNLEPQRDFTHTRDVARALWLLSEHAQPGEVYNLCAGQATRIGEIVQLVLARGRVPVEVRVDPARLRPSDEPILLGDNRKLRAATGWEPTIGMSEIVDELLAYWRDALR